MRAGAWLGIIVALLAGLPAAAQIAPVSTPTGPAMAGPYVMVDAATGETLLERNPGAPWYPASLTKLMTIYLTFQQLKAGYLSLSSPVPFSAHAAGMPETRLGVAPGTKITVEQALESLVVHSANDSAVALGELIGGSEPGFAERMNDAAKRLGMTATHYVNANGLPNPGQITTARDLALLAVALTRDFPQYYPYFQTHDFAFGKRRFTSGVKFVEMYSPYADGMKTGFICASGFNLVGSAVRDGRRLIGVSLGFRRADLRDEFMVRLFDEAYRLKTGGNRAKVWQLRNLAGAPPNVFTYADCNPFRYDYPGDAVWLGTYANWQIARRAYDQGQAALAELGATVTGKEWILPVTADKTTRQAAFIADLVPAEAQRLCESYRSRKLFCQVVKPQDIVAPFGTFWH
ncbi:MAG TPA: D-alanyl-D-alanine carboxypeptidase family protein [Reyranella sp.]|nr:D-alanyl-D-alanine carboxypeptidase family protein [Reyranella sp.]